MNLYLLVCRVGTKIENEILKNQIATIRCRPRRHFSPRGQKNSVEMSPGEGGCDGPSAALGVLWFRVVHGSVESVGS